MTENRGSWEFVDQTWRRLKTDNAERNGEYDIARKRVDGELWGDKTNPIPRNRYSLTANYLLPVVMKHVQLLVGRLPAIQVMPRGVTMEDREHAEKEEGDKTEDSADALDSALLEKVRETLGEQVSEVRSSQRLTDSASCLVLGEQEMALHLQRLLEQAGQSVPDSRPVLELNAGHPLVEMLQTEEDDERFNDLAQVLFEQALLSEGGSLTDPAGYVSRVNALLLRQAVSS